MCQLDGTSMIHRLVARLVSLCRGKPAVESNVDLVESLVAERQFREDKLRRETAIDQAMTRAHSAAVEDNRAAEKAYRERMRPTPITRKLRGIK